MKNEFTLIFESLVTRVAVSLVSRMDRLPNAALIRGKRFLSQSVNGLLSTKVFRKTHFLLIKRIPDRSAVLCETGSVIIK